MCVPHHALGGVVGDGRGECEPKRGERENADRMETIVHNSLFLYLNGKVDATLNVSAVPKEKSGKKIISFRMVIVTTRHLEVQIAKRGN
jgi:hypothetical protein